MKLAKLMACVVLLLFACSCEKNDVKSENNGSGIGEITTASTTTSIKESTTTSSLTTTANHVSVTTIQNETVVDNCYISSNNAKLLYFSGLFDYNSEVFKLQTLDANIINNLIYELNNIEYISAEKVTMSDGGNWSGGFWDMNIYKDGKVLYNIHTERTVMYIIDLTVSGSENNCTILTINESMRHNFESKVFNFTNEAWVDYVNYLNEFLTEITKLDTYGGVAFNDLSGYVVLVASEDFSAYKEVENRYSGFHSFPKIKYQTVDYSLKELNQACEIINQHASEYFVYQVTADSKNNRIQIYILQDTEENRNALTQFSPVKNIEYIPADDYLPHENPVT